MMISFLSLYMYFVLQYYSSQLLDEDNPIDLGRSKSTSHGLPSLQDIVNDLLDHQESELSTSKPVHFITAPHSTTYCTSLFKSKSIGLTKQQPAHDCNHIRLLNRSSENGIYWIDPNLGCSSDAILVYCNFTLNETCISPIVSFAVSFPLWYNYMLTFIIGAQLNKNCIVWSLSAKPDVIIILISIHSLLF